MERELRTNLIRLKTLYCEATGLKSATVGNRAASKDWEFFARLEKGEGSFTARKYDEIIGWFSGNWPENARWPKGIARPRARTPERAA